MILKIFFYTLIGLLLFFSYYIFPFQIKEYSLLVDFRNYYSICTGISGIILGFFYYFHKLYYENRSKINEKKKKELTQIIDELKVYDRYVEEILNKRYRTKSDYLHLKNKALRSFEDIEMLLRNSTFIGFETEELSTIIEVNSFIENLVTTDTISFSSKANDLMTFREEYIEKIKAAKLVCMKK